MADNNNFLEFTDSDRMSAASVYLLGFLWADGYEYSGGYHHTIRLQINKTDAQEISDLFLSRNWSTYSGQTKNQPTWQPWVVFQTSNKSLHQFLIDHNFKNKSTQSPKSLIEVIPNHLRNYWWRGYSDGDGYFSAGANAMRRWGISSTFDQDWSELERLFSELQIDKYVVSRRQSKKGHRSSEVFIMGKERLRKLGMYLYPDGVWDNLGLKRKYDKWLAGFEILHTKKKETI